MSFKSNFLFVILVLLALSSAACSAGGTTPAQDGGNPDNDNEPARISGSVSDNGNPVEGVEVVAYDVTSGSLAANSTTDSKGIYKLNPVGGQYLIVAVGDTGYANPEYVNLSNNGSSHRLDINITRFKNANENGFIFCRIMNERDDTPIPNARLKMGDLEALTDAWGFCFLVDIPIQDIYNFDISANGFKGKIEVIRRNKFDRNLILNAEYFRLTPMSTIGASIGGVVRDIATGEDLGGVFVSLEKPDTEIPPITFMTNLGGVYRFYNLEKGTYFISASRTGYFDDSTQLIVNDEDGYFTLFLTPNNEELSIISGAVYDQSGSMPIPNVMVTISNPLFGEKEEAISDGLGEFTFAGLVYGDYYIFAKPINPLFLPQGVAISLDEELQEIQFNLQFNESGAILGELLTVINDTVDPPIPPQPIPGAKIVAEKIGAPMSGLLFETNSDAMGKYVINGVLPGLYLVTMTFDYAGNQMYEQTEEAIPVNTGAAMVVDFIDLPWLE